MRIIIPRLPALTSTGDLRRFTNKLLSEKRRLPFTHPPEIEKCGIIAIVDQQGVPEYHGLISIEPEKAGYWFISNIKGRRLREKLVMARPFIERGKNGRKFRPEQDRRRPNLTVKVRQERKIRLEGLPQFAQEYGNR